jgi:DNA polymerase
MLQEMHVRVWWPAAAPALVAAPEAPAPRRAPPASAGPARAVQPQPGSGPDAAVEGMDMPALAQAVAACGACRLCEGRKTAVFGASAPARQTDWMVVGDPPTDDDERAARPFAGEAGELLDNMLRAVQCHRDGEGAAGAWLTHVVKCLPAQVRNPQPDELARCAMYLRREVALVRPRVILALGRYAALSLLAPSDPEIARVPPGKLRGRVYTFEGVPVVVSYSPARLLRAPAEKAGAWADLCLARSAMAPPADDVPG